MCLAIPLKVIETDVKNAVGEVGGVKRRIRVDFLPDVKPGDYVIAHAGFAIEKLDEARAKENLETILEVADAAAQL